MGGVSACALGRWGDEERWLLIKKKKKSSCVFEHFLPFSRHLVWHQRNKWKPCKTRHQSKHLAPSLGQQNLNLSCLCLSSCLFSQTSSPPSTTIKPEPNAFTKCGQVSSRPWLLVWSGVWFWFLLDCFFLVVVAVAFFGWLVFQFGLPFLTWFVRSCWLRFALFGREGEVPIQSKAPPTLCIHWQYIGWVPTCDCTLAPTWAPW